MSKILPKYAKPLEICWDDFAGEKNTKLFILKKWLLRKFGSCWTKTCLYSPIIKTYLFLVAKTISLRTSSHFCMSLQSMKTLALRLARSQLISRPMPELAPVTKYTLSSSFFGICELKSLPFTASLKRIRKVLSHHVSHLLNFLRHSVWDTVELSSFDVRDPRFKSRPQQSSFYSIEKSGTKWPGASKSLLRDT